MTDVKIPCNNCGKTLNFVFDPLDNFKLKILWCNHCDYIEKPVGRERKIKPDFYQESKK